MSNVRVPFRKPSSVQFVETARELVVHAIRYTRKFPKSAMLLITKDIVDESRTIYKEVLKANSIKPQSKGDVAFRQKHFYEALGALNALDALLSIAVDIVTASAISEYGWTHWGELILNERKLLKGIISSDRKLTFG